MSRVYNFSAGPSCLPEEALAEAASELLDYHGSGQSVMEMSHRSKVYEEIQHETGALVRELMQVGDDYEVLFLQGGASAQFAMIPLNLTVLGKAAYVDTGVWATKAAQEAEKFTKPAIIASSKDKKYSYIPSVPSVTGDYDYLHITLNNTIMGTKWPALPDSGKIPLVSDISSCVLSEPIDISRFALVYAGAQKNLAPAGVTLVIVRRNMLARKPLDCCPAMLRYTTHV
jgi:phosphoserine aminotransferase